ncbi:hypothetical protein ACJX0J_024806, partial [Zea mays]
AIAEIENKYASYYNTITLKQDSKQICLEFSSFWLIPFLFLLTVFVPSLVFVILIHIGHFQVVDAKPSCFPVWAHVTDWNNIQQLSHILLRGTRNSLSRGAVAGTVISCKSHTTLIMDHKIGHGDFGSASQEFLNEHKGVAVTFLYLYCHVACNPSNDVDEPIDEEIDVWLMLDGVYDVHLNIGLMQEIGQHELSLRCH